MALAGHLKKSLAEIQELSGDELALWRAYRELEPWDVGPDIFTAQICCLLANCNRGKKQRAFKVKDFLWFRDRKSGAQQEAETKRFFEVAAARSRRKK